MPVSFVKLLLALLIASGLGLAWAATAQSEIVLWHTQDKEQKNLLERIIADFSKQTAIAVRLETGMEIEAALVTQVENGTPPDVVFAPANLISFRQAFLLTEVSKADLIGIDPQAQSTVLADGKPYGVPIIQGNHLMLFAKDGTTLERTWEQLAKQPRRQIAINTNDAYIFLSFYRSHGGTAALTIQPTPCIAALDFYRTNLKAGLWVTDCGYQCVTQGFYSGKYPFALNGDWAIKDGINAIGKKFRWHPLPQYKNRIPLTPTTSHALLFPGGRKSPIKAKELAALKKHFLSQEVQEQWWRDGFRLPVNLKVLTATKRDPRIKKILAASFPLPTEGDLGRFWHGITKGLKLFHADHQYNPELSCKLMERMTKSR